MTDSEVAYWSALTQVFPVLGLALVIEIRAVMKVRSSHGLSPAPAFLAWLWFLVGGGILAGLIASLEALRNNKTPEDPELWFLVAVAAGFILIFLPAALVFGGKFSRYPARFFPTLMGLISVVDYKRRSRRILKLIRTSRRTGFETLGHLRNARRYAQIALDHIQRMPEPWPENVIADEPDFRRLIAEANAEEPGIVRDWRASIMREINYARHIDYMADLARTRGKEERELAQQWARQMMDSMDSHGVFTKVPSFGAMKSNPDDGGFFEADAVPEVIPYRDKPYVVRNIEDFLKPGRE